MLYSNVVFPVFTFVVLLVIITPFLVIAVYSQFYKKHLNKVLTDKEYHGKMASPQKVAIVSTYVILFISIFVSFIGNYRLAKNYYEQSIDHFSSTDIETYYAEVITVNDNILIVDGISMNEEKYQGEFKYEITGEVSVVKDDKLISVSQLEEGDLVSVVLVTGEGHIEGITDVFKITVISE